MEERSNFTDIPYHTLRVLSPVTRENAGDLCHYIFRPNYEMTVAGHSYEYDVRRRHQVH